MENLLFLAVGLATLPTLLYVLLIYSVDRYEKEPFWLLSVAFFWGAFPAIVLTLTANWLVVDPILLQLTRQTTNTSDFFNFLSVPFVEESVKGLVLLGILVFRPNDLDTPLDGIIYGSMVGMGFAMVENYFYFLSVYQENGLLAMGINFILRAIIFGLNHALFTGLLGFAVAIGRYYTPFFRIGIIFLGWSIAVFFHAVHNFTVNTGGKAILLAIFIDWLALIALVFIIFAVLWREQQWLKLYLLEEINLGTLSHEQYEIVLSRPKRTNSLIKILWRREIGTFLVARRFYQRLCKLAYYKHHYALHALPDLATIDGLRQEVTQFGQQIKKPLIAKNQPINSAN